MQYEALMSYGRSSSGFIRSQRISIGEPVTGTDVITDVSLRRYSQFQTGEYRLVEEGKKCLIKNIFVRLYSNDADANDDPPYVILMVKPVDRFEWIYNSVGSCSTTSSTCTFSVPVSGLMEEGDASETVFDTPARATKCRIYVDDVKQVALTDYTITGNKEITFISPPGLGAVVRAVWPGQPWLDVHVNDFVETSEGFHRITSIDSMYGVSLDWYPVAATSGTHVQGKVAGTGTSETIFPIHSHLNSMQLRVIIIPADTATASSVIKAVGFDVEAIVADDRHLRQGGV